MWRSRNVRTCGEQYRGVCVRACVCVCKGSRPLFGCLSIEAAIFDCVNKNRTGKYPFLSAERCARKIYILGVKAEQGSTPFLFAFP